MSLKLVWRFLLSHPVRSILTCGSIVVAVFLLCVLRTTVVALGSSIEAAAANRLVVQSSVSLFVPLPLSYQPKIEQVDGIEHVIKWTWFGGYYKDPQNFFAQFAVDAAATMEVYPEMEITEGSYDAFLASRQGALIGRDLAEKYEWSVGDRVPIIGTIYPRADGGAWEFDVEAIYDSRNPAFGEQTLLFHHTYFEEVLKAEQGPEALAAGVYIMRIEPGTEPTTVMAAVDALFESGPQRVQTTTEAEFNRQFVTMFGGIPTFLSWIGGSVLFAILLAAINTMLMAGRERTRILGVMKAMGFGSGSVFALFVVEAVVLCGAGGLIGVAFAKLVETPIAVALSTMMPGFVLTTETILAGLAVAVGVGLVAALVPAIAASRLRPVEALRAEV